MSHVVLFKLTLPISSAQGSFEVGARLSLLLSSYSKAYYPLVLKTYSKLILQQGINQHYSNFWLLLGNSWTMQEIMQKNLLPRASPVKAPHSSTRTAGTHLLPHALFPGWAACTSSRAGHPGSALEPCAPGQKAFSPILSTAPETTGTLQPAPHSFILPSPSSPEILSPSVTGSPLTYSLGTKA